MLLILFYHTFAYSPDTGAANGGSRDDFNDRESSLVGDPVVARQVSGQRDQRLPSQLAERT